MKNTIMTLIVSLFSFTAFADTLLIDERPLVDARIEVRYYEDQMPEIIPNDGQPSGPRNHYRVEATVNFCRNVQSGEFELSVLELGGINLVSLHSNGPVVDCFGSTHPQRLVYAMPADVNVVLPFAQVKKVPVIFEGVVH